MEPSSILDQNMDSSRVALSDLPIETSEVFLIDGLGQQELTSGQPQTDGTIDIAPLVGLLHGSDGSMPWQTPHSPGESVEAVTHLIEHPHSLWLLRRQIQSLDPCAELLTEADGVGGVLILMARTRHPQPLCRLFPSGCRVIQV
jgi:hypothetical protein